MRVGECTNVRVCKIRSIHKIRVLLRQLRQPAAHPLDLKQLDSLVDRQRLILKYLTEGRQSLTFPEWKGLLAGFDALHKAIVEVGSARQTFRQVYEEHVDAPFDDLYITRFYEGNRQRTLVVMLQVDAWNKIDGDTVPTLLRDATTQFPSPALVNLEKGTVVIADYEIWKAKVSRRQRNEQE